MSKLVVIMTVFLLASGCTGVNPSPPAEEFTTNTTANNNDDQQTTDEQLVDFREDTQEVHDTLSVIEAESLVHDYLNLEAGSDTIVMFDSRLENGDYLISVFDLLEENKGTAQHKDEGLYAVDPETGEIKKYNK
jgi:hypothetical protein